MDHERSMQSNKLGRSRQSKKSRTKPMERVDILNQTDFCMGIAIIHEEADGSVELDESELFLDEKEDMINLKGIVGSRDILEPLKKQTMKQQQEHQLLQD